MLKQPYGRRLALAGVAFFALAQGVAGAAPDKSPLGPPTQPVQATKGDEDPLRTYSGPFLAGMAALFAGRKSTAPEAAKARS